MKFIKLLAPFFRSLNAYAPIRLRLFKIPKAPPPTTQPLPSGTPPKTLEKTSALSPYAGKEIQ